MTLRFNPDLDLRITRIIKAPPALVWKAWTESDRLVKWWLPEPSILRIVEMDVRPGGALITEMSESGGEFTPHFNGSYLALEENRQLVFTNAVLGGWRPAEAPFMTASITFSEHPKGTDYLAHVMHASPAGKSHHEEMGFYDGWGTVTEQLARLVEQQIQ